MFRFLALLYPAPPRPSPSKEMIEQHPFSTSGRTNTSWVTRTTLSPKADQVQGNRSDLTLAASRVRCLISFLGLGASCGARTKKNLQVKRRSTHQCCGRQQGHLVAVTWKLEPLSGYALPPCWEAQRKGHKIRGGPKRLRCWLRHAQSN